MNALKTTLFLMLVVIVATLVMFQTDEPDEEVRMELCYSDGRCTFDADTFWQDYEAHQQLRSDETLPPHEGA